MTDPEAWNAATVTYAVGDVQYDADDEIVVDEGDVVSVAALTLVDGTVVDPEDYVVVYFEDDNNDGLTPDTDKVVQAEKTENNVAGEMPIKEGNYYIVLVDAEDFAHIAGSIDNINNDWPWNSYWERTQYKAKEFTVQVEKTSIEGAYAYQGTAEKATEDRVFNYTGAPLPFDFAVDGKVCSVNVEWTELPTGVTTAPSWNETANCFYVTESGTYTAKITGKGTWTGTEEVTFTVEDIDLSADEAFIAPIDDAEGLKVYSGGNVDNSLLNANGVQLDSDAEVIVSLIAVNGDVYQAGTEQTLNTPGRYTFRIQGYDFDAGVAGDNANVKGQKTIDAYVVKDTVTYAYNGKDVTADDFELAVNAAEGTFFTTDAITAEVNGKDVAKDITVTKDGEPVTTYTEPGVYEVTLDTPVDTTNFDYAGHATFEFTVEGKDYAGAKVFLTWEGKNLVEGANVVYDANAVDPTVTVKLDGKTLVEGEDYTVELQDAKGNAVESAVDCGNYQVAVTFNGTYGEDNWTDTTVLSHFNIVQATIVSAEAVVDTAYEAYPLPADGSAVAPTFKGYTENELKGDSFDLAASDITVTYHDEDGEEVAAADLTVAGKYTADITVKNTAKNLKGSVKSVPFTIADAVSFVDVDANEWYAEYVYAANQQHYMNGYKDTKLFVPNAPITRAEIAQVVYNMAGAKDAAGLPNPDFDDVVETEWYANAIAFVNAAQVMTGYDDTETFGVNDNATREQIATTMYRYAKVAGIDTSVEDEAAALAEYTDGDQVSGFAKTAMAWAVENGIMGVDVTALDPQGDVTRAQVAAISVRVQPKALETPVIPAV